VEIIQCVVEEGRSGPSGGSGCGGQPGDFVPGTEAVGHLAPVFLGVEQVTTGPEVWGWCCQVNAEEDQVRFFDHKGWWLSIEDSYTFCVC
jgi:hypothetical protein